MKSSSKKMLGFFRSTENAYRRCRNEYEKVVALWERREKFEKTFGFVLNGLSKSTGAAMGQEAPAVKRITEELWMKIVDHAYPWGEEPFDSWGTSF